MKKEFFKKPSQNTKAKLELYSSYLDKYLRILSLSQYIDNIVIFDLFSGPGIYTEGTMGSPVIAYNAVKSLQSFLKKENKPLKEISLVINDKKQKYSDHLKEYFKKLETLENFYWYVENNNFSEIYERVLGFLDDLDSQTRVIIFLDPFGYKEIEVDQIEEMLNNRKTEIFLFLPISDIRRFIEPAIRTQKKAYEPLIKLLNDIASKNDGKLEIDDDIKLINSIRKAFEFNSKYFAGSYYLQRKNKQHYSLFFISNHILGLEKFLESKIEKDTEFGEGNRANTDGTMPLFNVNNYNPFEPEIEQLLLQIIPNNKYITNNQLYENILKNQYLPKIVEPILNKLINVSIELFDKDFKQLNKKPRSFYLKYSYFKGEPKLYFKKRGEINHGTI